MKNEAYIKLRLEELKSYVYSEINQLIHEDNKLNKYKPTKHQRAHKTERNLKKRCYVR